MSRSILAMLGCTLFACGATGAQDPEERGTTAQAIVVGAASAKDSVGMLRFDNDLLCSGFAVSPNVVITAAFCFNGGAQPVAFYTGTGTAAPTNAQAFASTSLTKWDVSASGKHPKAVTQTMEGGLSAYTADNDVGYVVLRGRLPASVAPLPYGDSATAGKSCTAVGYGRDGAQRFTGMLGARREGAVSIDGFLDRRPNILQVSGDHLSSQGDFGGPLLCSGNVVGVFSAYHYNESDIIDVNAYQATNGEMRTWIDGVVARNPPPPLPVPDAGATSSGSSGGSSSGTASGSSSGGASGGPPPANAGSPGAGGADGGGCSFAGDRRVGSLAPLLFGLLFLRRRARRGRR